MYVPIETILTQGFPDGMLQNMLWNLFDFVLQSL